jgi:hypothetical protein
MNHTLMQQHEQHTSTTAQQQHRQINPITHQYIVITENEYKYTVFSQ